MRNKIIIIMSVISIIGYVTVVAPALKKQKEMMEQYVITDVQGNVTVKKGMAPEVAAKPYTVLKPADEIKAKEGSNADIVFKSGKAVRVKDNTQYTVEPNADNGAPRTSLRKGTVLVKVSKDLTKNANKDTKTYVFSVQTPQAVAGVRGTEFLVSYYETTPPPGKRPHYETKVAVSDGTVHFEDLQSFSHADLSPGDKAIVPNLTVSALTPEEKKQLAEINKMSTQLPFVPSLMAAISRSFLEWKCSMVTKVTTAEMTHIEAALIRYNADRGKVPDTLADLHIKENDSCGVPYLYTKKSRTEAEVRSAGPDMEYFTGDDIVLNYAGQ
ncbi:MAG: FecR family protein [Candidatus Magnetominusculus sp. LBB02]|nr:FecR family protein [Candidatus Magnetominusculus sp. LBB02]